MTSRSELGARIAEAMGWTWYDNRKLWRAYDDHSWTSEELVSWHGYGIVDAWMREQGYGRQVVRYMSGDASVAYFTAFEPVRAYEAEASDEPLAAIQAALKALEARE